MIMGALLAMPLSTGVRLGLFAAAVALRVAAVRDRDAVGLDGVLDATQRGNRSQSQGDLCCCPSERPSSCRLTSEPECPAGYRPASDWGIVGDPPPRCAPGAKPPGGDGAELPKVLVRVFWIRHGWSCANALDAEWDAVKDSAFADQPTGAAPEDYPDPPLTDASITRAKAIGAFIRHLILESTNWVRPLVFSSFLQRSIETAMYSFPDWSLHPIPFVAEMGDHRDGKYVQAACNEPKKASVQKGSLVRHPNEEDQLDKIIYDVASEEHPDRKSGQQGDYEKLLYFLAWALQELWELKPGEVIPVVIVSHGRYMIENLPGCSDLGPNIPRAIPQNNQVWTQTYELEWGASFPKLEPTTECLRSDKKMYPEEPPYLCDAYVRRCTDEESRFMPTALLNKDRDWCEKQPTFRDNIVEVDTIMRAGYVDWKDSVSGEIYDDLASPNNVKVRERLKKDSGSSLEGQVG